MLIAGHQLPAVLQAHCISVHQVYTYRLIYIILLRNLCELSNTAADCPLYTARLLTEESCAMLSSTWITFCTYTARQQCVTMVWLDTCLQCTRLAAEVLELSLSVQVEEARKPAHTMHH